jgi:hypothetical protein
MKNPLDDPGPERTGSGDGIFGCLLLVIVLFIAVPILFGTCGRLYNWAAGQ